MKAAKITLVALLGMTLWCGSPGVDGARAAAPAQNPMLEALDARNGFHRWKLGTPVPAALRKSLTKGGDGVAWAEVGTVSLGGDDMGTVTLSYFKGQLMRIAIECDTETGWEKLTRSLWDAYGYTPGAFLAGNHVQLREAGPHVIAIESIWLMAQKRLADIEAERKRAKGSTVPL